VAVKLFEERMMKAKSAGLLHAEKIALYEKLIATHPKIKSKGAANAYTSVNGHMFSLLRPAGEMALRLPADEREKFLKKFKTKLYEAYGTVMPEYVAVPDEVLQKTGEMKKYLAISYEYVRGLKPKPTKKKAK
jgi:TfoX/Sxy family transcriptional regulator of competence genes